MNEFTKHACEQVLRFSQANSWAALNDDVKAQLIFNVGAMAHGLNLSKEEGYLAITNVRKGEQPISVFRENMKRLILEHNIEIDETMVARPF